MIKREGEYRVDRRREMRGGNGEVKIEHFWEAGSEMLAPNRMFARLTLNPGCSIGFHRHEGEEEVFFIVKGIAEADDNGAAVRLQPGDTILTGNGAGHSIKCVGTEPLEMIAVISSYPASN